LGDLHADRLLLTAPPHLQGGIAAGLHGGDRARELAIALDRMAVHTQNDDAGPSFSTELTSAPRGRSSPKDSASCALTSWIVTPIRPRTTWPVFTSWSSTFRATSI